MSARQLCFKGTVQSRGDASSHLKFAGDAVLVERGRPRLLLISCPCGCGEEFPINLDSRAGPAWRLYRNRVSGVSLFPSVWRKSGCKSHYVIWRNKILLLGLYEEDVENSMGEDGALPTTDAVRDRLPLSGLISYSDVADALDAVPWDVLMVCRQLVQMGLAREGMDDQRGSFGRV